MELREAFEIIFNEAQTKAAISLMQDNPQETGEMLLQKLKEKIEDLKGNQENLDKFDQSFPKILHLLASLNIKDAFPCLLELLQLDQHGCLGSVQMVGQYLAALIPDEDGVLALRNSVVEGKLYKDDKNIALTAVVIHYRQKNRTQELELFFLDVIFSLSRKPLEYFEDFETVFLIAEYSFNLHCGSLEKRLKELLIQLIIHSKSGSNASWFKVYWQYLYRLDPLIAAKIHDSELYIHTLRGYAEKEIFECDNFAGVGKLLFAKTLGEVRDATPDIVKLAIKNLRQWPFNERPQPSSDKEYYEEICGYLGLKKLPKKIYEEAKKYYQDIFQIGYPDIKTRIAALIEKTEIEREKILKDSEAVISEANRSNSVLKTIDDDTHRLVRNEIRVKEFNSLYKAGQGFGTGMLVFYQKELEGFFSLFSGELGNQENADKKLREISSQCAFSDTRVIEDYFSAYRRVVQQMAFLLADEPSATLQSIFYNVKFIPYAEEIQRRYRDRPFSPKEDVRDSIVREMQDEVENHPLHPTNLMACAKKNPKEYANLLDQFTAETVTSIKKVLATSICLKKRKAIIEYCLELIEGRQDELAINFLPVQMEGLFADLLEYTGICEYISDIRKYKSIFGLELVQKIECSKERDINIPFNAIAYFRYYFSSVVRNTVAHGNYFLLTESRGIHGEYWKESENRDSIRRILSLELLLDLNYLISVIATVNEIDTADKYIEDTAKQCLLMAPHESKRELYDCLFDDLDGTRDRFNMTGYKYGIFVRYEANQILFWIFNPYYEKYVNNENLKIVRTEVCSTEFWEYAKERVGKSRSVWQKEGKFGSCVKKMLRVHKELMDKGLLKQRTIDLMNEVIRLL